MSMLNMLLASGGKTELNWSGNAIVSITKGGIEVSKNLYRWKSWDYLPPTYGTWQSVSLAGVFSGNSIVTDGIIVSGNLLRPTSGYDSTTAFATYTASSGTFSGTGRAYNIMNGDTAEFQTSGGLMRIAYIPSEGTSIYSPYISLT